VAEPPSGCESGRTVRQLIVIAKNEQEVLSASPEVGLLAYFEAAHEAFHEARAQSDSSITRSYSIAGRTINFHFAGHALVSLIDSALSHLATNSQCPPHRTICLWDRASTGTPIPPLQRTMHGRIAPEQLRGNTFRRIRTAFQEDYGALSLLDTERDLALFHVPSAEHLPIHERAAPVRIILHWCIESSSVQLIHAGAVGTSHGGIVLAGKGGAGKSTTALTCLERGMQYVGDDYIAIDATHVHFAWSLYSTAKLNNDSVCRLPRLAASISNPNRPAADKALVFLADRYRNQIVDGFPIKAIVLPQVTDQLESEVVRVSGAASLVALAPGSIFYLPDAGAQAFHTISTFVKEVPSYALRIGKNGANIPDLLADLLHRQ
jgi:hypothetical protein